MYAVIETGGKQYRVEEGMKLEHELVPGVDVGGQVEFDRVLLLVTDEGVRVGTPYLAGTAVRGEVASVKRGDKIVIYKYKAKKGYRRKQGHRQEIMTTTITSIGA
ncbi:MAG: 50S ribosomal protein L21 [Candidatus Bipolaricaulota bacterium]